MILLNHNARQKRKHFSFTYRLSSALCRSSFKWNSWSVTYIPVSLLNGPSMVLSSLCGNVILSWSLLSGIKGHVNMLDTSTARGKNRLLMIITKIMVMMIWCCMMKVLSTNNYNEDHVNRAVAKGCRLGGGCWTSNCRVRIT